MKSSDDSIFHDVLEAVSEGDRMSALAQVRDHQQID
jgi:hypothetical protein